MGGRGMVRTDNDSWEITESVGDGARRGCGARGGNSE